MILQLQIDKNQYLQTAKKKKQKKTIGMSLYQTFNYFYQSFAPKINCPCVFAGVVRTKTKSLKNKNKQNKNEQK